MLEKIAAVLLLFVGVVSQETLAQDSHAEWKDEIATLLAADTARPPPQNGVVFAGSSSIRMWSATLTSDFPGVPVVDRGFGGSVISDSTFYADRIIVPLHPRLIVFYAGDNDIFAGRTAEQTADDFKAFVARVRSDLPHVAIAYISIKPSVARWKLWPTMRDANDRIAAWTKTQQDVTFVDIAPRMLDADGKPRPELLRPDGLHMLPAGYAIWIEALRPVLKQYGFIFPIAKNRPNE